MKRQPGQGSVKAAVVLDREVLVRRAKYYGTEKGKWKEVRYHAQAASMSLLEALGGVAHARALPRSGGAMGCVKVGQGSPYWRF